MKINEVDNKDVRQYVAILLKFKDDVTRKLVELDKKIKKLERKLSFWNRML